MEFNNDDLIVYTCLIGENEGLNSQPSFKSSHFRHVCLTDNKNLTSDEWEIVLVDKILPHDNYRSQRHFKIRPHHVFPNYKFSIYLDNTVVLKKKTEDFLKMIISEKSIKKNDPFFCLPYHSQFDLISEFNACAKNNLDDQLRIYEQLNDYIKTDLSALKRKAYWGGILFRNHSHKDVINFSEIWFSHICRYSRRDQLSIIHASIQSDIYLNGLDLNNSDSVYHKWPITKIKRKNRNFKNSYVNLIPHNYLENLTVKIRENKSLLLELEKYKKTNKILKIISRLNRFYNKFKNFLKSKINF